MCAEALRDPFFALHLVFGDVVFTSNHFVLILEHQAIPECMSDAFQRFIASDCSRYPPVPVGKSIVPFFVLNHSKAVSSVVEATFCRLQEINKIVCAPSLHQCSRFQRSADLGASMASHRMNEIEEMRTLLRHLLSHRINSNRASIILTVNCY